MSPLVNELRRRAPLETTNLAEKFVRAVREGVSRRTGRTADSVQITSTRVRSDGATVTVRVNEESGRYQDEGTGIYGPEGRRIEARPGGVLAFDWPAAGGMVFVHSVAGSPGNRFWTNALNAWPDVVRSS